MKGKNLPRYLVQQGWVAVDHEELIAPVETEQETYWTATPWYSYLQEVTQYIDMTGKKMNFTKFASLFQLKFA